MALLALGGCASVPEPLFINPPYDKPATPDELDDKLTAWFECDECVNGQLRRIQELGNTAVPELVDYYNGIPIPDRTAEFEARCTRINNVIAARGLIPAETCEQYKQRFQNNLERRYRARAFEALLSIRTDIACSAIGVHRCNAIPPFPPAGEGHTTDRSTRYVIP
jgi:hypothetical protein